MRSHLDDGTLVSSTARASSPEALENVQDTIGPCFASNEGGCFKENMNVNKFETPKLAVEPLQMKKKRKANGFNLRKSLAWDRAFFTEEGVLDPQELSFVSGVSCEEGLPFVNEHAPVGSRPPNKPVGIQKLNSSIFKELQTEGLGKDSKTDGSSQMFDSSSSKTISTTVSSHKVPTLVGCKISGSRYGDIPRPLSSSSLKRPANLNVGRTPGKESKQLKVPCFKPGLSPISATTKKTISRVNQVKHNQTTQRELKSACESLKETKNASKSLQSALCSDGNSGNSSYRRHPSIDMRSIMVDQSNKLSSNMIASVRPVHASEGRREFSTFAAPLSRSPHLSVQNMQPSQKQVLKPSGLRMPSPSLSFFSQPKPPVFCDSSSRGTGSDTCDFLRHEKSRSKANLRTPGRDNKIIPSKDISSQTVGTTLSHVSAVTSIKPIMELAPMQKIQDYSEENRIEKTSVRGVAELQIITNEGPSQSEVQEKVSTGFFLKSDSDGYPENHQSCKSIWKNSEVQSEQRYAIQEPETISAMNESSEEKNSCSHLFLNHGTIVGRQYEDSLDDRLQESLTNQSDGEDACKPNCHGPQSSDSENVKCPLGLTDEHMNFFKSREREQLSVSQQNGSWCSQRSEALERRISKSVDSCLGSKDLHADLYKDASVVGGLVGNLLAGQSVIQSAVCNSNIDERENNITLISEVGNDGKLTRKCSATTITYPEAGHKLQICLEDQNIEKLAFESTYRKDGSNAIGTKMASSSSSDKGHGCENTPGNIGEVGSVTRDDSTNSQLTLSTSLKENECNIVNLFNVQNSGPELVQPPESSTLNESCFNQSDYLTLPCAKFGAKSIVPGNVGLHFENCLETKIPANGHHKENEPWSEENSVTEQSNVNLTIFESPIIAAQEEPLKHGICNSTFETCDVSHFGDSLTDSERANCEVFDNKSSLSSCNYPKLDDVEVEATLALEDLHGDTLSEKSCSATLLQNAIPFSDDWFAAIEAAGEDILAMKSGAVQNSPPDKSLPEPSPWSPVKKRNNQIGPFDCTKFNNLPSNSN